MSDSKKHSEDTERPAEAINPTKNVATTAKDLGLLTKGLIEKESTMVQTLKNQAAQGLKDIQQTYVDTEEVVKLLNFRQPTLDAKKEYEKILEENVTKLKDIVKDDFESAQKNNRKLIEETKQKLHDFIKATFNEQNDKRKFAETTGNILVNIGKKIKDDLQSKSNKTTRDTMLLSPDIGNVFVHTLKKPPEEIEAERLLQEFFEEQLLEFDGQIKRDFQEMNGQMSELVDQTKKKIQSKLQDASKNLSNEVTECKSIPNVPDSRVFEQNVNYLLSKTGEDFQQVKDNMTNEVQKQKEKINAFTRYYKEKAFGSHSTDLE